MFTLGRIVKMLFGRGCKIGPLGQKPYIVWKDHDNVTRRVRLDEGLLHNIYSRIEALEAANVSKRVRALEKSVASLTPKKK